MLTATAIFQNGQRFTQAFARESERIVWIAELRSSCKNKGIPCPEIIKGSGAMRKLTSQEERIHRPCQAHTHVLVGICPFSKKPERTHTQVIWICTFIVHQLS